VKRCSYQGKRKFHTKADAEIFQARRVEKLRVYECPYCGFWHLTSSRRKAAA